MLILSIFLKKKYNIDYFFWKNLDKTIVIASFFLFGLLFSYFGFFFSYTYVLFIAITSIVFWSYLGGLGVFWLFFYSLSLLTVSTAIEYIELVCNYSQYLQQSNVLVVGIYGNLSKSWSLTFGFINDFYNLSYILLTTTIGLWALGFTQVYMGNEPRTQNFIVLLVFFLLSMLLLLTSLNVETLLLGWEFIGFFSYLLINFWTTRISTTKAAFKAFTFNKLSDLSLLLALILLIYLKSATNLIGLDLNTIAANSFINNFTLKINLMNILCFFLIIAAFCKSAQFGFHVWLPDSMEAPVPASALIHSATLVSAGIFLIGRFTPLFVYTESIQYIYIWCSFTAFFGGIVSLVQTDLKKLLAYSTISHCGFLFCSLLLDNIFITIIYLHFHGWFKSFSFMSAGNLIMINRGYQDIRRFGNSQSISILNYLILSVSLLNLAGLPFTLGFFNKFILLQYSTKNLFFMLGTLMLIGASFCGIFYSFNILKNTFYRSYKFPYFLKETIFYKKSGLHKNLINYIFLPYTIFILFFSVFLVFMYTYCTDIALWGKNNLNFFYSNNVFNSLYPFIFLFFFKIFFFKRNSQFFAILLLVIILKTLYVLPL